MELFPPAAQLVKEIWEKLAENMPPLFQLLSESAFSCANKSAGNNKKTKIILFMMKFVLVNIPTKGIAVIELSNFLFAKYKLQSWQKVLFSIAFNLLLIR